MFGGKIYGIKIRYVDGTWETKWYGKNRDKRDKERFRYLNKKKVVAVLTVEAKG